MTVFDKTAEICKKRGSSEWADRICGEILYAERLSKVRGGEYDVIISQAADYILDKISKNGCISRSDTLNAEKILSPLSKAAKSYTVDCIGHAHIDMNWMWGFQETVAVTVDTFRTMLDLMKEFPQFTFAQSQASTYRIIEEYCPEMLPEIRRRVKEGRWELAASTWVETDKNMPNGESLCRHILYTKKYLSELFGVSPDFLNIDFEPDTFGHNISVPEILKNGGVKYYYHCRGYDGENIYNWKARSGADVLCFREPSWYNYDINADMFLDVPMFCDKYGIDETIKVFGVGDHGGGPTRRDIQRILDMASWPIQPNITFGTFHKFFDSLEKKKASFPVVEGELNYIFTGCYTSQSRIKMANRVAEARVYESEALCTASALIGGINKTKSFSKAWEKILFNHFHDIIPGSGVRETRECAMGNFQQALAYVNTGANEAMRSIAAKIDTSSIDSPTDKYCRSDGAGVGNFVGEKEGFGFPCTERSVSGKRIFHIFNTTQYDYSGVAEITVWDWEYDAGRSVFKSTDGASALSALINGGTYYWGHVYKTFAVNISVPAFGYATYTLEQTGITDVGFAGSADPRTDHIDDKDIVMENEYVKAVFSKKTMEMLSLIDKTTGKTLVDGASAYFRLIIENARCIQGMSAWRVGFVMKDVNLNRESPITLERIEANALRSLVRYSLPFGQRSHLAAEVILDKGSRTIEFRTEIDFHETGSMENGIPQINFNVPFAYETKDYRYDVPFGCIDRKDEGFDMPAQTFVSTVCDGVGLQLLTDNKYGYRGENNALTVDLVRGSYEPDPYPEYGMHKTRIGICATEKSDNTTLLRNSAHFCHPVSYMSVRPHKGTLPLTEKAMTVSDNIVVSAVKICEDSKDLLIRVYEPSGNDVDYTIAVGHNAEKASLCDINENELCDLKLKGSEICGKIGRYAVQTIKVRLGE